MDSSVWSSVFVIMYVRMTETDQTEEAVGDLTSVLNFISFTFVRWKNDKNVQLRDFLSKIGQCFLYVITMKLKS